MRHYLLIILYIITIITSLLVGTAPAQSGNTITILYSGAPTGTCAGFMLATNISNGDFYNCPAGTWNKVNSAAGGVTSLTGTGIITNSGSTGAVTLVVAGTSGGIPYFSSSSTWATSAVLAANQPMIGGGAGAAPSTIALTFSTLTDGSTITWAIASAPFSNATVTLGGNRTLNITNPLNGGTYILRIVQDGTGSRTLTLGTGCTWKISGSGAGAIVLSTAINSIDVLAFVYDGTNCYGNLNKAFT